MFEEPQAKRVRRSKVFDAADSSSDEEVTAETTIESIQESMPLAYHFDYDLIENSAGKVTQFAHLQIDEPAPPLPEDTAQDAKDEASAFEFRLFSTPNPPTTTKPSDRIKPSATQRPASTRINIRSPTPDTPSDGRFITPSRPDSYYFTNDPTVHTPDFTIAAITGESILRSSSRPWPGSHLPWRIIHLPHAKPSLAASRSRNTGAGASRPERQGKRKPNKRRRILLRTRQRRIEEKAREKEEHLREKKTRLNRERKVKRREKERAEKEKGKGKGKGKGDAADLGGGDVI